MKKKRIRWKRKRDRRLRQRAQSRDRENDRYICDVLIDGLDVRGPGALTRRGTGKPRPI